MWYSKAPLRIGLAGGGTDVSPYCDTYGGAVVNTTISLYAHASIEYSNDNNIYLRADDRNEGQDFSFLPALPIDGKLDLLKAVYNRIVRDYSQPINGFRLTTSVDAPAGSGLGTSSTLTVAIIGVFNEMLQLGLSLSQIAKYAYDIERKDLGFSGGRQDQYAAVFGGFNFLEFFADDQVKLHPLHPADEYKSTLEKNLVLYFTDTSRVSATIIEEQVSNVLNNNQKSIEAMHHLKEQAHLMKTRICKGSPDDIGPLLQFGFGHKKNMATNISNSLIDSIYEAALAAGSTGGKISGAGGGGFMVFYCPGNSKASVCKAIEKFGGHTKSYSFVNTGLETWGK